MIEMLGGALLVIGGGLMSASSVVIARSARVDDRMVVVGELLGTAFPPPRMGAPSIDALLGRLDAVD